MMEEQSLDKEVVQKRLFLINVTLFEKPPQPDQ